MGIKIILLLIIASVFVLIGSSHHVEAATFLVNSSNDVVDMDGCDGTHCSLREAINEANSNPGLDGINFQGPGPFLILPAGSTLPSLTGPVVIDGGGFQVVIDGQNAGLTADGLRLSANGNTIRGLVINNFDGNGIALDGSNSTIEGNKIGTNAAGTIARGNGNNGGSLFKLNGIQVFGSNNLIGGTTPATRNIISGNAGPGLGIFDSSNNVVQGNYIGTDITGTLDLGNFFGVTIGDAPNTLVGGTVAGARNIISGNDALGIHITTFAVTLATSSAVEENSTESYETMTADIAITSATSSAVEKNRTESYETMTADIAVTSATSSAVTSATSLAVEENSTESYETMTADVAFSSVVTNIYDQKYDDIQFSPKTPQTTVHQQIISNDINRSSELSIPEIQVSASFIGVGSNIEGNYVGTDVTGTLDLGNSQGGIQISNVPNTMIGGSFAARNIISGNGDSGFTLGSGISIFDAGATGNVIEGNFIGLDVTGNTALGNSNNGIQIQGGQNNVIGGISPGTSNYISANEGQGILIGDPSMGGTQGNIVRRNFIGTDITGTVDLGNVSVGVVIQNGLNNIIGGTTFEHRNHIAGNDGAGVLIIDPLSTGNMVLGNWIGTDITGTVIMPNVSDGVAIIDASNNTVGGTVSGARNIISGNGGNGVFIFDRELFLACCSQLVAFNNKVEGNFIGTDFIGINDLGNTLNGVFIVSSPANTIGGNVTEARNIISGNTQNGIYLTGNLGPNAFGNTIIGNRIGTNELGTTALGNGFAGIRIEDVPNNTVGGNMVADRNLISGNDQNGILILGIQAGGIFASDNKIEGNFIGTDVTGTGGVGNSLHGVFVGGAPGNTIGDLVAGEVNVISGNLQGGIFISGVASDGNTIAGNHIGTDVTGMVDLGNTLNGVEIFNATNSTIGGITPAERNIISGNNQTGILISGSSAMDNKMIGNYIGVDVTGKINIGNLFEGVAIVDALNNTIGGNTTAKRNIISGNNQTGILISGSNASGNKIEGNYIGVDETGDTSLGNVLHGIFIEGPSNIIGGKTEGARNIISGNLQGGIFISGADAKKNNVTANYIGTNKMGNVTLGNSLNGIEIFNATNSTIGGITSSERNIISGNDRNGIVISGIASKNNTISGNFIGSDVLGMMDLGNTENGIQIIGASSNQIGLNMSLTQGSCTGGCNLIFGNDRNGIEVLDNTAIDNSIRFNSIFNNTLFGIDLGGDGVTSNDNNKDPTKIDIDAGPNKNINFPGGVSANHTASGQTVVSGILKTETSETPVIDIYYNKNHDSSKFGEGQHYWGTVNMTSVGPNGTFNFVIPGVVPFNFVSAVTVGKNGSTSEFSFVCGDPDGDGNTDSDGDGLCDDWEISGIDLDGDNSTDLNLPALGAKWDHKDLFVEVDHWAMHKPLPVDFANITLAFANANVSNPDGMTGINIHIEHATGDTVPHMDPTTGNATHITMWTGFDAIKKNFFGNATQRGDASGNAIDAKKLAFRYALMVHEYVGSGGSSGLAEGIPGDDFIVSLGGWGMRGGHAGGNQHQIEGTFMHELGHTLGLGHGGTENDNCKPNYLSVMNYMFQFNYAINNRPLDYSRSELNTLREGVMGAGELSEPAGIIASTPPNLKTFYSNSTGSLFPTTAGFQVDWNRDGDTMDVGVFQNINNMTSKGCDGFGRILDGADDWNNIHYNFRNSADTFADGAHMPMSFNLTEIKIVDIQNFNDRATFPVSQMDNIAPVLVCPSPIFIMSTVDVPATNSKIQMFLNNATSSDNLDPFPEITHDAPVNFTAVETTLVTFTSVDDQTNSSQCTSTVSVGMDGACSPPQSGDWMISSSCTLENTFLAPSDVFIQNNSTLTIPNGVTLSLLGHNIHIQSGGIILIKNDGTLQVTGTSTCGPPVSGDWMVTSDCTLSSSDVAPGNVIVQNNAVLTIPAGVTLDIDLANFDLIINSGGSVLIKEGGLIT